MHTYRHPHTTTTTSTATPPRCSVQANNNGAFVLARQQDVATCVCVSEDGAAMVTGGRDGSVCVWQLHLSSCGRAGPFALQSALPPRAPPVSPAAAQAHAQALKSDGIVAPFVFDADERDAAQQQLEQQSFFADSAPLHRAAAHDDAVLYVACSANLDVFLSASKGE